MNFWSPKTLKSLVLPGAVFLVAACVVFQGAFGSIPSAAVHFYFYAVFAGGFLLAWRFHSSRVLFALCTLFLAQRALEFFSSGRITAAGPGRIALEAVAFLLPLNFIAFSVFRERGLILPAIFPAWRCCSSSRFLLQSSAVREQQLGRRFSTRTFSENLPGRRCLRSPCSLLWLHSEFCCLAC